MDADIRLHGQLENWPSKDEMASLFASAGFLVDIGRYSIRLRDCEHFVIQEYGGDLGQPQFDASASTLAKMHEDAGGVSAAFKDADLRHRFELYDDQNELVGYLHHRWPKASS